MLKTSQPTALTETSIRNIGGPSMVPGAEGTTVGAPKIVTPAPPPKEIVAPVRP